MNDLKNCLHENIPTSVLQFYTKLYIKKFKHSTNSKKLINEATRSWILLKAEDKKLVKAKYEDFINRQQKKYAECLKNMEPYLKKNSSKISSCENRIPSNKDVDVIKNTTYQGQQYSGTSNKSQQNSENVQNEYSKSPDRVHTEMLHDQISCSDMKTFHSPKSQLENESIVLSEPAPPLFTTAQDFFLMVQSLDNDLSTMSWKSMSSAQKRRYQTALSKLKKQYLYDYKRYLETLSSVKLIKLLRKNYL